MDTLRARISLYGELAKAGIVTLVLVSVCAGYLLGQPPETLFHLGRMLVTITAVLLLASGSSALNQYQERHLDAVMPRTSGRPLPSGRIRPKEALLFIFISIISGVLLLSILDTLLIGLGILALVSYNGLYTLWWKRRWSHAAVPGALPGALPIVMGYAAASGTVYTPTSIFLFALLYSWQMPHFWALSLRYRSDYAAGGFPTLAVTHGTGPTIFEISIWCLAYVSIALMGPFFLPVRVIYSAVTLLVSLKLLLELKAYIRNQEKPQWLKFFSWMSLSLIIFLVAAVVDAWTYRS